MKSKQPKTAETTEKNEKPEKKPKQKTREQKISRRYFVLKIAFAVVVILLGISIYSNVDYLIFKYLIAQNYIYTDTLDTIYKQQLGEENFSGNYLKDFDNVVIGIVTQKIRETGGDRYTYLYTPVQLQAQNTATRDEAKQTEIKELTPETVYFRLPNVSKYSLDYVSKNKEKLNGYDNLIIDLQSNHGGEIDVLYKLSDLFLPKGKIIGREVTRLPIFSKTAKTKSDSYASYKNIYILIDGQTASAAEGFTMSLKENLNNVTVVGKQSFGKGIGQITLPLLRGYAVKATVLKVETPLGNSINKVGITPDIEYDKNDIVDYVLNNVIGK